LSWTCVLRFGKFQNNYIFNRTDFHSSSIVCVRNPLEKFLLPLKKFGVVNIIDFFEKNVYRWCKQIQKKIENVYKVVFQSN
jgi:hypothetical protein